MTRKVFYSFHYDNDCFRVQQIRNMGIISDETPILSAQAWEQIKQSGDASIKNWIDPKISNSSIFILLVGSKTSTRTWCQYEFNKAKELGKTIIAIYIHNLKCPNEGKCEKGNLIGSRNDYDYILEPSYDNAYNDIYNYLCRL